jgi:hypothetical protein
MHDEGCQWDWQWPPLDPDGAKPFFDPITRQAPFATHSRFDPGHIQNNYIIAPRSRYCMLADQVASDRLLIAWIPPRNEEDVQWS